MENCSVKQYRTAVNNQNLDYFDALQISMDWSNWGGDVSKGLPLGSNFGGVGVKVKVLSNGSINGESSAIISDSNIYLKPIDSSLPTEFLLIGLSKITGLYLSYSKNGMHMKDPNKILYCENIQTTEILPLFYPYVVNSPCDISEYLATRENKNIVTSFRSSYHITYDENQYSFYTTKSIKDYTGLTTLTTWFGKGDVYYLSNLVSLTSLNLRSPYIYGNIASLGKLTSLTTLNLNTSNVSGTIEDWVAAQCSAPTPRTSASNIEIRSALVTYMKNGSPAIIGTAGKKVSWNKVGDNYNITVASL